MKIKATTQLIYNGNKLAKIPATILNNFKDGDELRIIEKTGELLHIPKKERNIVHKAVSKAHNAFSKMGQSSEKQCKTFFKELRKNLLNDHLWSTVQRINITDVKTATSKGRSTTRLIADDKCRRTMIAGIDDQLHSSFNRHETIQTIKHNGWKVDAVKAPLGVIGFVFEGRPNVLIDATGVIRLGNTVVCRIGSDAQKTAQAILEHLIHPALAVADLPLHTITLVQSTSHASGWALFSDSRLSFAVARGSGKAVQTLGAMAQQNGIPASLHGTGGAWMILGQSAAESRIIKCISNSLDRKVCNTLNTLCILENAATTQIPIVLKTIKALKKTENKDIKLHIAQDSEKHFPYSLFENSIMVRRATGDRAEPQAESLKLADLSKEWEWESTPEISIVVVKSIDEAIELYNQHSPQFVLSVISENPKEIDSIYAQSNAPFFGNGFTRWVDGQYALQVPELGLSNWEQGRILGRSGILSGDNAYTIRLKMTQTNTNLRR